MISKLHLKSKIIIGSKATRHPSGAGACARLCQQFLAITFRMDVWLERQKDNIHKRPQTKEKPSARGERHFIPLKGCSRKGDFPFYS